MDCGEVNKLLKDLPQTIRSGAVLKIDTLRHPFVQFTDRFNWPVLPLDVRSVDGAGQAELLELLIDRIPGWLSGCHLLPEARPKKEDSYLHFVRPYQFAGRSFLYLLKIGCRYMGGATTDELSGGRRQNYNPAFVTDRIYFQARLIPIEEVVERSGEIVDFKAKQLAQANFDVRREQKQPGYDTTALLFDDIDFGFIEKQLQRQLFDEPLQMGSDPRLKHFRVEYLTLCLAIFLPRPALIQKLGNHFNSLLEAALDAEKSDGERGLELSSKEQLFWQEYFNAWQLTPVSSRAGNPQWQLSHLSDVH